MFAENIKKNCRMMNLKLRSRVSSLMITMTMMIMMILLLLLMMMTVYYRNFTNILLGT